MLATELCLWKSARLAAGAAASLGLSILASNCHKAPASLQDGGTRLAEAFHVAARQLASPAGSSAAGLPAWRRGCSLVHHAGGARWRPGGDRQGKLGGPIAQLIVFHPCTPLQWSLGLPWADASTGARVAVFGDDHLVAFTGLDGADWQLVGAAVAGPSAGRVLWTTELPLGSSLPSAVTAAGDLAVVELDGSVFGLHPRNGSVAFIRTAGSLCSLGDPRLVSSKCVRLRFEVWAGFLRDG